MTSPAAATVTLHIALGVPSRELALEVSDAFYHAMVRAEVVQAVDVSVPKQIVDILWSNVEEVVLVCFFPWCLTKGLVAPVHRQGWLYAPRRFVGLVVDSGHICVARSFHLSRFRLPHAFLRFVWPVASSPSV